MDAIRIEVSIHFHFGQVFVLDKIICVLFDGSDEFLRVVADGDEVLNFEFIVKLGR